MDFANKTSSAGYRILGGRYALSSCLSVSPLGELHQAIDIQLIEKQGMQSKVLLHLLPAGSAATPLQESVFHDLKDLALRMNSPQVLSAIAYGQDDGLGYFVLEVPPNAPRLQAISGRPAGEKHLHAKLASLLLGLKSSIGKGLEPGLLLVTPADEVYVAITALLPELQQRGAQRVTPKQFARRHWMLAGLFGLTLSATASSVGLYYGLPVDTLAPQAVETLQAQRVVVMPVPVAVARPAVAVVVPVAAIPAVVAVQHHGPKPLVKVKEGVMNPAPTVKHLPAPKRVVAPVVKMDAEQLIQAGYAAIADGQLDTAQGKGATYFIQQLQQVPQVHPQFPEHPQVKRLAREVASLYQQQARRLLQGGDGEAASQALARAEGTINEFNLVEMNPAQALLVHKLEQ